MCRIVGFITKRKFIELRQDLVEQKIKEHLAGEKNHQYRLWSILMWEMWRERWLGA